MKVIIIIDECDVPIKDRFLNNYYEGIIRLMKCVFSNSLKGNDLFGFTKDEIKELLEYNELLENKINKRILWSISKW